jgi:DMSO/TMAO reductase YedYZ molybdopterin-dependent catalytic subunit
MVQPQLPPGQQLAAEGKWPQVGERAPRADAAPWSVAIAGAVERPLEFSLPQLQAMPQVEQRVDIHCVTRWSKLDARFGGVPLARLLELACPDAAAKFVSFVARSQHEHSTSLPLEDALRLETLVALTYEGQPLPELHGGPVRTVVPGRYFYKSLKWLARIELLETDCLGFWEGAAGYHNTADPWLEQRYLAAQLDRQEVKRLLTSRDFSGRDLRSIDAAGHDLPRLDARGALLRDADFRRCDLQAACFDRANLSNAHLEGADLRGATFRDADVEGANLAAADLRGADFRGASLFGATFVAEVAGAIQPLAAAVFDATTQIDLASLDSLTPLQAEFVRQAR